MSDRAGQGQSGGISVSGTVGSVGGDMVGGDKIVGGGASTAALDEALRPVLEAIRGAPSAAQPEAEAKVSALRQEVAKGKSADDRVVARLVDGLVGLIPKAAGAVVGAFGTPILGAITGPVTGFVLDKLRGE